MGRATFGRPWIFREIRNYLDDRQEMLTTDWKLDVLRQQVLTSVERLGEYRGILHSRRHLAASPLFKGIPNFRETRIRMLRSETVEDLFHILDAVRPIINCEL